MKTGINAKKASWIGLAAATLLVTCNFNVIPFPIIGGGTENYGDPCYSPNMEYHIKRYTTLPKALIVMPSHSKSGLAILYYKTGKEIYRGFAHDIYKPGWQEDHVSFFGGWGSGGYSGAKLPTSAGGDFIGCFSPNHSE